MVGGGKAYDFFYTRVPLNNIIENITVVLTNRIAFIIVLNYIYISLQSQFLFFFYCNFKEPLESSNDCFDIFRNHYNFSEKKTLLLKFLFELYNWRFYSKYKIKRVLVR